MEKKKSEFDKVLGAWDILVIAFGAMIGWGWVVSSGNWIESGGVLGAAIAFAIGGIMIFFVGLTYAELTAAMPQCGGEHVFSYRAMGSTGSFICTWAIILGYVSVACFEACAFPTIITYLWPGFLKGYLYTVAGFDVYASWLIVAIVIAFLIMIININGAKTAAVLQTVLTCIIGGAGIILIVASVVTGSVDNLQGQMFVGNGTGEAMKSIIKVAVITPFFFIGFDVIPQAAEEINVPLKKIGKMMILSVVLAVVFYSLVILAVGFILNPAEIIESQQGTGLVTADAMAAGNLIYAGKYSAPDYELLLSGGCTFAIENTMITHNPEVKEKLEELGIKVMIERSSYEKHPLGRLEWIKLFGVLFGREQQAKAFFDAQAAHIEPILEKEKTGLSVAFFAVASDGTITVRKPNDYVSSMIELAGGTYSLNGYVPEEENALSTLKMQMEDFYAAEKDADILIYNGTIEGELTSIDELVQKNSLFADFKAVKSGQVYTTGSNFYQQTSGTCDFIEDLNKVLNGETDAEYRFLKKIN